jgi:hypothetical protein
MNSGGASESFFGERLSASGLFNQRVRERLIFRHWWISRLVFKASNSTNRQISRRPMSEEASRCAIFTSLCFVHHLSQSFLM